MNPVLDWPEEPYKGLDFYAGADQRIFAGRQTEVEACAGLLASVATQTLVLHGKSGCGKSSFIRAGLVPHLTKFGYSIKVPREVAATTEPIIIRSGSRPLKRLAEGLYDLLEKERKGRGPANHHLRGAYLGNPRKEDFCRNLSEEPELIIRSLECLARAIPETLIIFIDQSEEIFTLLDGDGASAEALDYLEFLAIFSQADIDIKLVISMRTEYKGLFDDELARLGVRFGDMPGYYLPQMTPESIRLAIEYPTIGEAGKEYRFKYEAGLAEHIASQLYLLKPQGGTLPVMQVICRRLFRYTGEQRKGRSWIITEKDFRELGSLDTQLDNFLEEGILAALVCAKVDEAQRVIDLDRWREVLQSLCAQEVDGRVVTKQIPETDIINSANDLECQRAREVGRHLEKEGIIKVETETHSDREQLWSLGHDSIGLVLSRPSLQAANMHDSDHRRQLLLTAGALRGSQLFTDKMPPVVHITSVNDQIWDHEIPLYASSKGFFRRLGIEIEVSGQFDLRLASGFEYQDILKSKAKNMLISIPRELFGQSAGWREVGVSNLFAGYALVGRSMPDLLPLKQLRGRSNLDARRLMFRRLMTYLGRPGIETKVVEDRSGEFVKFLCELACVEEARVEKVAEDLMARRRDILYHCLLSNKADFVIGPAPTRALAERAGFIVYLDAEDVFGLIEDILGEHNADFRQLAEDERRKFAGLYMHNTWLVSLGDSPAGLATRDFTLRLASVLFFTVAYIRAFPEDFVRFLYYESRRSGGFPIDRLAIRKALSVSYKFVGFEEQKMFFDGQSEFSLKGGLDEVAEGAFGIYSELVTLRGEFWQHWAEIYRFEESNEFSDALGAKLRSEKERAWRHYEIYNFIDAEAILRVLLDELRGPVKGMAGR